ncbi:hypothetical protein FNV43_RR10045 [Rhamnella rubrinervis]|uniref:RNase H type-1 domain-containing protein n=1 Tax=Rhamnella rubrinervis TaxID=2594499 RepID=A0A8K0MKI5_9ROSA|nr:hypothetical protein FNV43_RR10045 [Rhamnella rubrinervis]
MFNSCLKPTEGLFFEGWKRDEIVVLWNLVLNCVISGFNSAVEDFLDMVRMKSQASTASVPAGSQRWCPPKQGFIKVNIDAAFVAGQAAAAMVIRDDQCHLLYLASKLFSCVSPFVAEAEALCWVAEYAEQCKWRRVEWETDAKEVEKASRKMNAAADAVAKLSLLVNGALVFDEFSLHLVPRCILDILLAEQADAAL